jgi:hypothetical protein
VLSLAGRRNLLRLATLAVIVTGMLTIDRGIRFAWAHLRENPQATACPYCESDLPARGAGETVGDIPANSPPFGPR